jgi:hypothetical protein
MERSKMINTHEEKPNELCSLFVKGHIKIYDPVSNEVFRDQPNAINYENFSIAMAQSLSNQNIGMIEGMAFGNGGSRVDATGIVTYLTPNVTGIEAGLYNQTYFKVADAIGVNGVASGNIDPARNFIQYRHLPGAYYSDILISCLLDFGEPSGQQAFDNSVNSDGSFVFDEIGIKAYGSQGQGSGAFLTHVIFHPIQKSLNRLLQIDYTIRVQSLSTTGT